MDFRPLPCPLRACNALTDFRHEFAADYVKAEGPSTSKAWRSQPLRKSEMTASAAARLKALRQADLAALHAKGSCPDPTDLRGAIDGSVLTEPVMRELRIWRGKVFDNVDGSVTGLNRLGVGPLEVRRYRFTAHVGPSLFGDRDVVLLDHDSDANPPYIRRFHDELVQIDSGLYLATSHYRVNGTLRYLCHFALATDE